ncbi:serine/threonine-protein kinase [Parabacteroides sp. FAFU027]|uniref:serine/threonine-protein kinase n=1 Tax=Parabacteroides sp. FAFU027 TaxID=2922715 RepID=UPI001FAFE3E9|nr:serine/threonine-protein kinase [Parabacteroides sp. FAFU027]
MRKGEFIYCKDVRYSLIESIGIGGSGEVWKATTNNEYYAIKFLHSIETKKGIRFENELKFCAENSHKNICSVIAAGMHKGKRFYVMPLYTKTLREIIHDEKDADLLVKYILQLCVAIKFAHKNGVVHRDIKPENILIAGRKLVLADFGIAHFKDSKLTKPNDLLVSRNYLAPEQKLKNNANNIEKSADIYALGLVINECFTKQNPAGSSFKVIADDYPLFFNLDTLVENMTKQNPIERFTIEDVIVELKYIHGKIKQDLQEIQTVLLEDVYPNDVSRKTLNKIINRASEDILFAKMVFETKSLEEINKINLNWHKKIGYNVDSFLFNICFQERILTLCKNKFVYESNVYKRNNTYTPLNLDENKEHLLLYHQMSDLIDQYPLKYEYERFFDLSGQILKYFSSCADYHCKEILKHIQENDLLKMTKYHLLDAPVLWIVSALKNTIEENRSGMIEGYSNIFGAHYKFNLDEHISINWSRTINYETNEDDLELIKDSYVDDEKQINEILIEFQRQWQIVFNKIDERYYSIKFKSYRQFEKFRKHTHKVANLPETIDIIKGEILDIIKEYNYANGIVEIKLSRVFYIAKPLPIILGLKKDYD